MDLFDLTLWGPDLVLPCVMWCSSDALHSSLALCKHNAPKHVRIALLAELYLPSFALEIILFFCTKLLISRPVRLHLLHVLFVNRILGK